MKSTRQLTSLSEIDELASWILGKTGDCRVLCFHGSMGAGKTTLIRAICKKLGVTDEVQSPTFSIVNEYEDPFNQPVYHFDFYRLKNEEEAFDLGYEDYLYSGSFCFIEWPEKIQSLLNLKKADIFIELNAAGRQVTLHYD